MSSMSPYRDNNQLKGWKHLKKNLKTSLNGHRALKTGVFLLKRTYKL